jgi:YD repeat-containing protein
MSDATGANYDYDAEGRMTSFSNSSATATYTYDGIGKRVHRVVNGTRYDYVAAELCVQKVDHREGQDRETPQNEGSRHCRERNRESQVNHLWQVFDQLNGRWVNTSVPWLTANQWSYIRWNVHRGPTGDVSCEGMPRMYYDSLTVNGVLHVVNVKYPGGHLPHGWSSANGFQVQIDIGSTKQDITVDEFIDEANFSAL